MKENIIKKKQSNKELSYDELDFFFNGYLNEKINDNDMTLLLKAICKNGLTDEEIFNLTDIFINSGETIKFDDLTDVVDKHSTGGVGDKTTLIVAPIVAASNVKIAKMSGRALGFTGGTIDKLESIKDFKVNLSLDEFKQEIKDINMAITSQTGNLCPMDKKVYALRDVTNTTESIGLIAASIMSKKIASGADIILIDIKVGSGALIKNISDARELARIMIIIGNKYKRKVKCMLTKMDNPLGDNIGNKLEVLEAMEILQNKKENALSQLTKQMASELISMGKNIDIEKAKEKVTSLIESGKAYEKFLEFVKHQNGDTTSLKMSSNNKGKDIVSPKSGYIKEINAKELGMISMSLGAGRKNKEDKIDYEAGIVLRKNIGDSIKKGEVLATIYGKNDINIDDFYKAFKIGYFKSKQGKIIIEIIG